MNAVVQYVRIETWDGKVAGFLDPTVETIREEFPFGCGIKSLDLRQGRYSVTLGWDKGVDPDDDNLAVALDSEARIASITEGTLTAKTFGRWFIGMKEVAPPFWPWPKINAGKWRLQVGWRYTAYTVGFGRRAR